MATKTKFSNLLLFSRNLYAQDLLPPHSYIIGFARSDLSVDSLRAKVTPHVTLKSDQDRAKYDRFWADGHVSYVRAKSTASIEEYRKLERSLAAIQRGGGGGIGGSSKLNKSSGNSANDPPTFVACHRVFYFALPPHVYAEVATAVRNVSMAKGGHGATTKIVLEKPFGSDLASSNLLSSQLSALFTEQQLYRMDHYLGKEMVQNLLPFRFANAVFEPLWNRRHVDAVELLFKESFGTYGRGGYFDAAGIIRDVVQNHLLQALTLLAMEEPASLSAEDVRNRKVELLKAMRTLTPEDTVLGQYAGNPAAAAHEDAHLGYTDDPGVSNASKAATYSLTVLHIDNDRWRGVPFVIRAGKALDANQVEARVYFRPPPNLLYSRNDHGEDPQNVLILRIQPNEAIVQRVRVRRPGLEKVEDLVESTLDLTYSDKFKVSFLDKI